MNQLMDRQIPRMKPFNPFLKDVEALIDECVSINKDMLIYSLNKSQGYSSTYILETFVYKILAGLYQGKSSEQLLELISGGGLFEVKDMLLKAFQSDPDIVNSIPRK